MLKDRIQETQNELNEPHYIPKLYGEFYIKAENFVEVERSPRRNVKIAIFY